METPLLALLFFIVALVYASAGFGGGSTYLAVLALAGVEFMTMRSTALVCNLVVVGGSCWLFYRQKLIQLREVLPFALVSIPAAVIGGWLALEERGFFILLGVSLLLSGIAMLLQPRARAVEISERAKHPAFKVLAGGGTGLLAGLVGIGGGIFLSPIAHLARWAAPHRIAGLTACFILVNSAAGLCGQALNAKFRLDTALLLPLTLAVLIGGQLGARLSLKRIKPNQLRSLTALLIIVVGLRVLIQHL